MVDIEIIYREDYDCNIFKINYILLNVRLVFVIFNDCDIFKFC